MALFARHLEMRVHRPAPPDLDHVAHGLGASRLPHKADIHPLAVFGHIVQQRRGPVEGVALFVPGDRQHDGAIRRCVLHEINRRRDKGRHAGFHIRGAAAIHDAVFDLGSERGHRPIGLIPDGDHIGMAVKAERLGVALVAPAGKKVANAAPVHARTVEPSRAQHLFQHFQRTIVDGGDRGAAHQFCGEINRVETGHFGSFSGVIACPVTCVGKSRRCQGGALQFPVWDRGQSKNGVIWATMTEFSSSARCINSRSSPSISWPSASRSSSVP